MQALAKVLSIAICNHRYSPVKKVTSTSTLEKGKELVIKGQSRDFSHGSSDSQTMFF